LLEFHQNVLLGHALCGCDEPRVTDRSEASHDSVKMMYSRTMREGSTIQFIRVAVQGGRLNQPFRAGDVNRLLGID
jgi:hypothetical protein